jgi:hydrogenase expression/formation protein HypE
LAVNGTVNDLAMSGARPLYLSAAFIAEALTGVISLDNLLIIATYFGKLPRNVIVIEVEPADDGWGEGLTPEVETTVPAIIDMIRYYTAGN